MSGTGCETTEPGSDEALLGLGLMGMGYGQNNPGAVAVGQVMVNYGAAKAGRSEVNVNIQQPSQSNDYIVIGDKKIYGQKQPDGTTYYPVPQDPETQRIIQERLRNLSIEKPREEIKEKRFPGIYVRKHPSLEEIGIFSCNQLNDHNKNNVYDYPEEFLGIKDRFTSREKISVLLMSSSNLISDIKYKLVNRNGEVVDKLSLKEIHDLNASQSLYITYNNKDKIQILMVTE